jgi:hypothetical protein
MHVNIWEFRVWRNFRLPPPGGRAALTAPLGTLYK